MDVANFLEKLKDHVPERIQPENPRRAAVLIPLVEEGGIWKVLFEVRAGAIRQGGDVCFPGGVMEEGETPETCARRETAEELLMDPADIEVLGKLHELTGPGNREVTSVLGVLKKMPVKYSESEVAQVFAMPLSYFLETEPTVHEITYAAEETEDFPYELIAGGKRYSFRKIKRQMYFYEDTEPVIWGMTASVLWHAVRKLREWML